MLAVAAIAVTPGNNANAVNANSVSLENASNSQIVCVDDMLVSDGPGPILACVVATLSLFAFP